MLLPGGTLAGAVDITSKEPPATGNTAYRPEKLKNSGPETLESAEQISPDEEITAIVVLEKKTSPIAVFQQRNIQREISNQVLDGKPLEVLHTYTNVENGFAVTIPYGKLDEIRALDGVAAAYAAPVFKVAPDMPTTMTQLGGLENSSGYQGEGMVIAIVDSGLEISHPLFQKAPDSPALTQDDVANVLTNNDLHVEEKKVGTTASQVYKTAKVPFAFDYADNDYDVAPNGAGDHGTHVAGIAAANEGVVSDVVGVAPQAQILAMKVFSSSGSNGATWGDILAAADDAVALGADVINMSLGSTCGFSTPEGDEEVAKVFKNIAEKGVMLSISAGNEYSAALGTRMGKGHALTDNVDYGTVASPSSYEQPLSVASMEKTDTIESTYFTAGDRKIAFQDTAEDSTAENVDENSVKFRSLAGKSRDYVVVPNYGATEDYEGLDVTDKIALVSRGSIAYTDKKNNAKAKGAAGIIVYNNEPGMLYMLLDKFDLPSAFISQADGKYLVALAENQRKLTVSGTSGTVDNPTSGEMSDFSSWGVTPELTLKPDITAPGGNIKSATTGGGYTTKSGTSMSAPFVSGAMALVKQYVEQKKLASTETDKAALVNALLMSTAEPVLAGSDPYSPRKQGAGAVNIAAATSTKAYLTTTDGGRPKLALGDDPSQTGKYTLEFQVHSLSTAEQTYTVGGYVQTDAQEVTKQLGGKDVHQVTELPYRLEAKIPAQTVKVPAKGTVTVTVQVTLTQKDLNYIKTNFSNGSYVEGFVTITPESDVEPVLSIPYMGFCGDWTKAPIVDATDYGDVLNGKDEWAQAYVNTAASSSLEGTLNTYLGDNPYHSGESYLADRNAISPNDDDYMDTLSFVYTGLLRNVKKLHYEIKDASTNEVYYEDNVEYETKSVYNSNYYQILPAGAQDHDKLTWDGTKKDHSKTKNNTKAIVTVSGELAYDKNGSNNVKPSWSFPITIDTEEPEAKKITVRKDGAKYYVDLEVKDNQYVSNITVTNNAESKELASFPIAENQAGATTKCSYDVTGFGENLKLVVNDYACNRKVYSVKVEGNVDNSEIIVPTKTVLTEDFEKTSFPPEGWSLNSQSDKTWYQGTEYGSKMAMVDLSKTEQQKEWLITPSIDLKAQTTTAGMVFDLYTNYYWSVQNHHHNLKVMASADNGANWEQIWQLWDWNQKDQFGAWEKTQAKVSIPEKFQNEQNVKFAFVYEGKDSTSLWMDNVQVYVEDPSQVHTITASAGEGGTIDPSGTVNVADGKSRTFTITPDEGYYITDVKVDGNSVGTPTTYTFSKVTDDHTIEVTFGGSADTEQLIDEDFESGTMPSGWKAEKTNTTAVNGTWTIYKYFKHYGLYCSADEYDAEYNQGLVGQNERAILPAQKLNGKNANIVFEFSANPDRLKNGKTVCTLEGSTDGGQTWTTIWNAGDAVAQLKKGAVAEFPSAIGTANISIPVPAEMQKDGVLFSFHYVLPKYSTTGSLVFIDNLKLQADKSSSGGGEDSVLLDENFDACITSGYSGHIPSSWSQTKKNSGIYTWRTYKTSEHITAYCTNDSSSQSDSWGGGDEWGAGQDEYLITPELDLANKTAMMSFQFSANQVNQIKETLSRSGTTFTLEASKDGTTWTPVWNAASIVDQLTETVVSSAYKTANVTVKIPAEFQTDGVKFAFRYQTKNGNTGGCTVLIDDVKLTASGGSSENPTKPTTYTITASAGQGGSIAPNGTVSVVKGKSQTFTITPSEGYEIEDVKVDGVSQGAKTAYEFTNVIENHTIAASFKAKTVTLPDSIHEDFNEGDMPNGWTVEGPSAKYNVETWKVARYTDFKSDAAVCSQNYMGNQAQNEKLILPQINMQDNMELTFDFGASYDTLSSGSFQFTVKATKDKGQTWTTLWDAKDHMGTIDENNEPENITGKGSIAIPAQFCDGSAQFAFVFESSKKQGGSVAVDNVALDKGSSTGTTMYGITIAAMEHGTVTANRSVAAAGDTITLTVTPEEGYQLKSGSLMANDAVVTGNTFTMPDKAVRITALFEQKAVTPTTGSYKDGTYTGSAQGRNGKVSVTVTVENGNISSIDVTEQKESKEYWQKAIAIIEKLLGRGNDSAVAGVDTVTGATLSSAAIKEAVQNALKNAVEEDSGIFASGNGSKSRPYIIDNVKRLQDFAAAVNAGENYAGKYIALAANLDLSDIAWTPIGTADHGKYNGFSGTFDGRGYTVSNVICGTGSASADYEAIGLFGVVDGGTVKNLNVTITKFYNHHDDSNYMTAMGGLTGVLTNSGAIDHCSVSGGSQVASETSGPKAAVGGLVGWAQSGTLIANSWTDIGLNYGTTTTAVDVSMGGICGKQEQNSLIANSASFGSVPGMIMTGKLRVGGLVGQTSGAIYNSYTTSLTKANVMGDPYNSFANNDATTAIGHLIGCSTTGAALYDCYYDKNADQFSNSDMAGDPEEGKTERRQATGWENGSNVKTDESFIKAKTASELTSAAFAADLDGNLKNNIKSAATAYFQSKNLLTGSADVAGMEDKLDSGFRSWALTGDRVLFGDAPVTTVEVKSAALLKRQTVAYGTAKSALDLPKTVEATLSDNTKKTVSVTWSCDTYNGEKAGIYTFTGTLILPDGITNPKDVKAYIEIQVKEKEGGTSGGGSSSGGTSGGSSGGTSTGTQYPNITAGKGGSVFKSLDGTQLTIQPDNGYMVDDVKVNGVSKGSVTSISGLKTGDKVVITFTKALNMMEDAQSHWAKNAIQYVCKNGLFTGTSATKFSPELPMNRAMLVTVLYRLDGQSKTASAVQFKDVAAGQWYADAVAWASENGIVSGYSANKFGPSDLVTREQIAAILYRYAKYKKYDVSKDTMLSAFEDSDKISNWAYAPMQWANAEKLINGRSASMLAPQGKATRAEVAQMLMNFCNNIAK